MPGNLGLVQTDSGTDRAWSRGPRPSNAVCVPHVEDRPSGRMSITNNTEQHTSDTAEHMP